MPYPIVAAPDDELAVIQYLRGLAQVTALVPAASITTELPSSPVYPVVLIQRIGGQMIWPALDEPAVQVDVLGVTKADTKTLTMVVRAAILAIANDIVSAAVLSSAYEEVGPSWLPDTVPVIPIPRYTARYRVLLHN